LYHEAYSVEKPLRYIWSEYWSGEPDRRPSMSIHRSAAGSKRQLIVKFPTGTLEIDPTSFMIRPINPFPVSIPISIPFPVSQPKPASTDTWMGDGNNATFTASP
jgi:hypothetical protein